MNQKKWRGEKKLFYILPYTEFFIRVFFLTVFLQFKKKYRIIHINNLPDFLVFAALVPKIFKTKVLLDIHDPMPETFITKFNGGKNNLLYSLLLKEESLSCFFADVILTVSEPIKNDILLKHGIPKNKIKIITNFADQSIFHFNDKYEIYDKIKLVFHGTIAERFGLDDVLFALSKVKCPGKFEFKIIGQGDYSFSISKIIKELKLENIVHFDNNIYNVKELPEILKHFNVGIISYKRSKATEFMLPVKLLEYFSMGIPVIAPKTKVISHYFNSEMMLFYDRESPNNMIEVLDQIADNPEILFKIRENEYIHKSKYSWEGEKIKYKNIIYSLMEKNYEK